MPFISNCVGFVKFIDIIFTEVKYCCLGDNMQKNKGFTLIELMVTIAVLAIIAMMAIPSFGSLIATYKLKEISKDYAQTLAQARSEAILTRSPTVVCTNIGNDGEITIDNCIDATFLSSNAAHKQLIKDNNRIFMVSIPDTISVLDSNADIPVYFSASGAAFKDSNSAPISHTVSFCSNSEKINITVSRMGAVTTGKGVC